MRERVGDALEHRPQLEIVVGDPRDFVEDAEIDT
jgi:hypothetical protein